VNFKSRPAICDLLLAVSLSPESIHFWISSICSLGIGGFLGGIRTLSSGSVIALKSAL